MCAYPTRYPTRPSRAHWLERGLVHVGDDDKVDFPVVRRAAHLLATEAKPFQASIRNRLYALQRILYVATIRILALQRGTAVAAAAAAEHCVRKIDYARDAR